MKTRYNPHTGTFDYYNEDLNKGILNVNCTIPSIIFELQLRRTQKMKITNRVDTEGNSLGNSVKDVPASWTSEKSDRGLWWIYLRYFGEIGALQNPKIGILHKARNTICRQIPNRIYGNQIAQMPDGGIPTIDVTTQVFVEKERRKSWRLLHDEKTVKPILTDLPATQGVWLPFMTIDDFIQLFVNEENECFKYSRRRSEKMNYQRVGITMVSEYDYLDEEGLPKRTYLHHSPIFLTIKKNFSPDATGFDVNDIEL